MWYNHVVTGRKHLKLQSVFSLAPIYVYQHLFYWTEKFVQSFNMWMKIPMREIDFWTMVVLLVCEEHMEESERLM